MRALLTVLAFVLVSLSPMISNNSSILADEDVSRSDEFSTWTISPTTGPHTGGTSLTLTTTGLSSYFEENSWENFTIDSSADVGTFSSIVADSNGELHIAYRDVTNGHLKYASNAGGSWTTIQLTMAEDTLEDTHQST